jgi:hypothetical protein
LFINGVEDRHVTEKGELYQPYARASDVELVRRAEALTQSPPRWEGLPRRFFRSRTYKGGEPKPFLGDSYDFMRFLDFVTICVHAFFGEEILRDLSLGWDIASTHGNLAVSTNTSSGLHHYAREVFRISGVVHIPPNTPAMDPVEALINATKGLIILMSLPPLGKFAPHEVVQRVRYALGQVKSSSLRSWFRASGYGFRSPFARMHDAAATLQRGSDGKVVWVLKDGTLLQPDLMPRQTFCTLKDTAPPVPGLEGLQTDLAVARVYLDTAFQEEVEAWTDARKRLRVEYADKSADGGDVDHGAFAGLHAAEEKARQSLESVPTVEAHRKALDIVASLYARVSGTVTELDRSYATSFRQLLGADIRNSYRSADDAIFLMEGVLANLRNTHARPNQCYAPPGGGLPICMKSEGVLIKRVLPGQAGWTFLKAPSQAITAYLASSSAHEIITRGMAYVCLYGEDKPAPAVPTRVPDGADWWIMPAGARPPDIQQFIAQVGRLFSAWVVERKDDLRAAAPASQLLSRPIVSVHKIAAPGRGQAVRVMLTDRSLHVVLATRRSAPVALTVPMSYAEWQAASRQLGDPRSAKFTVSTKRERGEPPSPSVVRRRHRLEVGLQPGAAGRSADTNASRLRGQSRMGARQGGRVHPRCGALRGAQV